MSQFVHLHIHSHYSLLTGLPKIEELVHAVKARGMNAVALTDYGSLYGAIEFYETAKKHGIKPIVGCEIFVNPLSGTSPQPLPTGQAGSPSKERELFHLVLLATNYDGYKNLLQLSSAGHLEGLAQGKPTVTKKMLAEHAQGLIALSGCASGEIPTLIRSGADQSRIERVAREYEDIFGKNNFYLELQDHPELEGQFELNNDLAALGERTGIPLVVTRDVHYLDPEDSEAQDIVTCIRDGLTVNDPRRQTLRHADRSLASPEAIAARFRHLPQALSNTVAIAERVSIEIPIGAWHFPPIQIPENFTPQAYLQRATYEGLQKLEGEVTPALKSRLDYELEVIGARGFAPYFLAVADYVNWARAQGIIATTRGSAAGSLVAYAIGITTVNPLRFKLPFERFLNPHRPSPPDIDVDFADHRRDEVIAYVTKKYGEARVAQICTFGTMMARAAVRDTGRALGLSYGFCDQVAKMIPFGSQGFHMTITRALETTPELFAMYNEKPEVKRLLDQARKIEGNARHLSVHAAGVVIAPTALTDFTPIQREPDGEKIITQYDMDAVEKAGLLKMDFLGIRNLSILEKSVEIVEKAHEIKVDLEKLPWDDKETYAMLGRGETAGVFQLGGSGMTRYLKELKPSHIFDIMAMVALFRPGPMESIPEFIRRKHNPRAITYLDPRMKEYLDASYGVITYQDDVLLTAINIAGYTWEEADKLRKAMGKKIPEEMAAQKEKFIEGGMRGGLTGPKALELWSLIEPFAGYGFGKAHAASYAVVAYQTAYMKAHFPTEYMAAVLSAESGDTDKIAELVPECDKMGISVLPPDLNESFKLFAVVPKAEKPTIRFGLASVKNVGDNIAEVMIEERKKNGPYRDIEDLLMRVTDKDLNKKSLESLVKCGAFDRFGDRGTLLHNAEGMLAFSRRLSDEAATNQGSLFGGKGGMSRPTLKLEPAPPASREAVLGWEKELLGIYVSAHPFAEIAVRLADRVTPLADVSHAKPDSWVTVAGMIVGMRRSRTKRGEAMLFFTLEDTSGRREAVAFPRTLESHREVLVQGATICVVGRVSAREGEEHSIVAERAYPLSLETVESTLAAVQGRGSSQSLSPPGGRGPGVRGDNASPPLQGGVRPARYASASVAGGGGGLVKRLEIRITPALKDQAVVLRSLFASHPGAYQVQFSIEEDGTVKKIATPYAVAWSDDLRKMIEDITGEGSAKAEG